MRISASGQLCSWAAWQLGMWASGHVGIWAVGHLGVWAVGQLSTWASGHLVSFVYGLLCTAHILLSSVHCPLSIVYSCVKQKTQCAAAYHSSVGKSNPPGWVTFWDCPAGRSGGSLGWVTLGRSVVAWVWVWALVSVGVCVGFQLWSWAVGRLGIWPSGHLGG